MRTIQKHIAGLYLVNVLVIMLLLFGFVVSIDIVTNLGEFVDAARVEVIGATEEAPTDTSTALRHVLATIVAIGDVWWPRLLQLYNYLVGVVLITAMGFTCSQLVKQRELVALMASGISLYRVARPFVLIAAVFASLQFINQEFAVPRVAPLLTRDARDAFQRDVASFAVRLAPDEQGRLWSAEEFQAPTLRVEVEPDPAGRRPLLTDVRVYELGEGRRVVRTLTAPTAYWDGGGWVLAEGAAATVDPTSPVFDGRASYTLSEEERRLTTALDPERLKVRHLQGFASNLGFLEITRMLSGGGMDPRASEALDRIRWGRLAGIASNLITLVAAIPFFLLRVPGSMLASSLKAAPIALAGLAASAASTSIEVPGLPIWLAAFLPVLLLAPIAVALFTAIRT
ncbi:MAG: LptF/LptG family permease [Planctomycetota bacterium]